LLNVGSHRGKLRIALIHPADDLQLPSAANALLKGLEEPPAGAIFILVSHRPARLLATVRSRCVAVPVPIPPRDVSLAWLGLARRRQPGTLASLRRRRARASLGLRHRSRGLERLLKSPGHVENRDDSNGSPKRSRKSLTTAPSLLSACRPSTAPELPPLSPKRAVAHIRSQDGGEPDPYPPSAKPAPLFR